MDRILKQYLIFDSPIKFESVLNYPLLTIIYFPQRKIVVKKIANNKDKNFLESVYFNTEKMTRTSQPIRNQKGKYITTLGNNAYILFPFYEEVSTFHVGHRWWVEILTKIHQINISSLEEVSLDLSDSTKLLNLASQYMELDILNVLNKMINTSRIYNLNSYHLVLNHGDPLSSNVMYLDENPILIDFESSILAPKEYDIQRHLCDYVIQHLENGQWFQYVDQFLNKYQNYQSKIDFELLEYLFRVDFCRTISWLYLVTQDKKRKDYGRQKRVLKNYINFVRGNSLYAFLYKLKRVARIDG